MKILLKAVGKRRIAVIKTVRWATGLSLKAAKNLTDRAPVEFECSHRDAREVLKDLIEDGASVELVRIQSPLTPLMERAESIAVEILKARDELLTQQLGGQPGGLTMAENMEKRRLQGKMAEASVDLAEVIVDLVRRLG